MSSVDALPRGLVLQHSSFKALLDGRLFVAPVAEPVGRVLDIGTGCGIWAAELAADHPAASVIGIDVFPQPTVSAPPNCRFLVRDAEQAWPPCRTDEPADHPDRQSKVIEWSRLRLEAASELLGVDQAITGRLPGLLSAAGFVDVQSRDLKWPIGRWMDDERMKAAAGMNLSRELLAGTGVGEQQIDKLLEQVGRQLGIGKIYSPVRVVWTKKPE